MHWGIFLLKKRSVWWLLLRPPASLSREHQLTMLKKPGILSNWHLQNSTSSSFLHTPAAAFFSSFSWVCQCAKWLWRFGCRRNGACKVRKTTAAILPEGCRRFCRLGTREILPIFSPACFGAVMWSNFSLQKSLVTCWQASSAQCWFQCYSINLHLPFVVLWPEYYSGY